jgi:chemotaxis protein MotB
MARKKAHAGHENSERWLVSYADLLTLLFAFFVVMFASSQTDKAKAKQVSDSVSEALAGGGITAAVHEVLGGTVDEKGQGNAMMKGPGGTQRATSGPAPAQAVELLPSMRYLSKELEAEIKTGKIQLNLQTRGLVVSLREAAFFPSGEDAVDPATYPSLEKVAKVLASLPNSVRLEGHTDSVPIHTARFRNNWELSSARAIAMLGLFTEKFAIPHTRLAVGGYADTVPADSNATPEGRAKNRRVDVTILSQSALSMEAKSGAAAEPKGGHRQNAAEGGKKESGH